MRYIFIILVICLIGCSVTDGPVWYAKTNRKDKVIQTEYSRLDTLHLLYYTMGAWSEKSTFGNRVGDSIYFSKDTIWKNITEAMDKLEIPLKFSQSPIQFEITNWYNTNRDAIQFKNEILKVRREEHRSKIILVPVIGYYTSWKNQMDAGLTFGSVSPSDKIEHWVLRDISLFVIHEDSLRYFCAARKSDTLTRDPSEPYRYHFPQELWDTLVYMSTRDYVERMR
ncbi:MAG: hypothetical protein ACK4WD_15435 [Flavobacteriales bacterium]